MIESFPLTVLSQFVAFGLVLSGPLRALDRKQFPDGKGNRFTASRKEILLSS